MTSSAETLCIDHEVSAHIDHAVANLTARCVLLTEHGCTETIDLERFSDALSRCFLNAADVAILNDAASVEELDDFLDRIEDQLRVPTDATIRHFEAALDRATDDPFLTACISLDMQPDLVAFVFSDLRPCGDRRQQARDALLVAGTAFVKNFQMLCEAGHCYYSYPQSVVEEARAQCASLFLLLLPD